MRLTRHADRLDPQDLDELASLVDSAIEAMSCALVVVTQGQASREVASRRARLMHLAQKIDRLRTGDR